MYHPQIDGRVNKVLKDMLKMYVMHQPKRWEEFLPLVEFVYNNGYEELLKMSLLEAIYGRKCNTPISWNDSLNKMYIRPNMLKEME